VVAEDEELSLDEEDEEEGGEDDNLDEVVSVRSFNGEVEFLLLLLSGLPLPPPPPLIYPI
jgi:hypothetical protein